MFHGNHLLYWSVRSEGVIYVNAYSGKIICGATSRTLSIWLDAVLSEDLHLLGQTAPGAFVAGKTVFSSCHEPQMMKTVNRYSPPDSLPFCLKLK